jgi:hypothetical protein
MSERTPWSVDCETLAHGAGSGGPKVTALIDNAAAQAKAGDLVAAADSLEAVRSMLVSEDYFRRYDTDIWVFTAIIRCIRRQSPDTTTPLAYQRLIDAIPSPMMEDVMTPAQLEFWYGSPDADVYGEIRVVFVPEDKKGCFIATATYGSDLAPQVAALQRFRDGFLLRNGLGRRFVSCYYAVSPPLAAWIASRPVARRVVRTIFLAPLLSLLGTAGLLPTEKDVGKPSPDSLR